MDFVVQTLFEKLVGREKEARGNLDSAQKSFAEWQKDSKASHDSAEIAKLLASTNAQADLAKAKSAEREHEQVFVTRITMAEVEEVKQNLNTQIELAAEAAPLVVAGGKSFVVACLSKLVFGAIGEHPKQANLSMEALLGGKEGFEKLAEFLGSVVQICFRPDLESSKEQRQAISEHIDVDSKGSGQITMAPRRFGQFLFNFLQKLEKWWVLLGAARHGLQPGPHLGWILVDLGWILVDLGGSWVDLGWILVGF